jgi:hypothetical protein
LVFLLGALPRIRRVHRRQAIEMFLLFVMFVATGSAIVIDRGLSWWRASRWRRHAVHGDRHSRGSRS